MAVADQKSRDAGGRGRPGHLPTISNYFCTENSFKKYKIPQKKGWSQSTRPTLIPPMHADDSQIYIILNPVASRDELCSNDIHVLGCSLSRRADTLA